MTFNRVSTSNLAYLGTSSDNTNIQTALNGLSTIGGAGGSVTVQGLQEIILNSSVVGQTQFNLTFNGYTTGNITYLGTAADATNIQTESMGSRPSAACRRAGLGAREPLGSGSFQIIFGGSLAGRPSPPSAPHRREHPGSANVVTTGNYLIVFGGSLAATQQPAISPAMSQQLSDLRGRRPDQVQLDFQPRYDRQRHLSGNGTMPRTLDRPRFAADDRRPVAHGGLGDRDAACHRQLPDRFWRRGLAGRRRRSSVPKSWWARRAAQP